MRHHLILRVVTKILIGPIILFALFVQFHGDFSPGGGFQAGAILTVAFVLYGIVFGMKSVQAVFPAWLAHKMMALGVVIFAGTGVVSMFLGYNYLDYGAFSPHHPSHGQHWGILAIELGVLVTVTGVLVSVYYAFASRRPTLSDEDW